MLGHKVKVVVVEVGIYANKCDKATSKVADALHPVFKELSRRLSSDYGGRIEHLWIELELIEGHARKDGGPRHPFRFQKRVSGRSHFGMPPSPDAFNVGHFSVRPDFTFISSLPVDEAITYALSLIYVESEMLIVKKKKLGGFGAEHFRNSFREACQSVGHPCVA